MLHRRGGDLSAASAAVGDRARPGRPAALLILDEPTEGIQPSIIKQIERVIRALAQRGDMAILLVEQYSISPATWPLIPGHAARRGRASGRREEIDEAAMRGI